MAHASNVLAVGIYLADRENTAAATASELAASTDWRVDQRWLSLGDGRAPHDLRAVTVGRVDAPTPKFTLVNRLLVDVALAEYDWILVVDDDIGLPRGFLDDFLRLAGRYNFALAQPARTHDSYIDHAFVEQLDGITARETRFVEIGPLFAIRRDAAPLLVPFDESSPMGWGYDFTWPRTLGDAGLKLGIVDATPIAHSLRKPVAGYSWETANAQQHDYLSRHAHVSKADAFYIVQSFV